MSFKASLSLESMGSTDNSPSKGDWKDIVARKRQDQAQAIATFLQRQRGPKSFSDGIDIEICSLEHKELFEALATGNLTAESVTLAYINR